MKLNQLRQLIREEISKAMNEEEIENLLQFIKDNKNEIVKQLEVYDLKNINSYNPGEVTAAIVIKDLEYYGPDQPSIFNRIIIQFNGKKYKMRDILDNPKMFLGQTVIFRYHENAGPEKKKIGSIILDHGIGFELRRTTSSDIDFSTTPYTSDSEEESTGEININGKTIYYIIYNV